MLQTMDHDRLSALYEQATGRKPQRVERLAGAGSNRAYYRLHGTPTLIGTIGNDRRENEAFVYLAGHFSGKGLPMPRILGVSQDDMAYIQEDLGSVSLFDIVRGDRPEEEKTAMLEETIRLLARVQLKGADGLEFSRCYPRESFDRRSVMWDLNYFKYCFLKPTGLEFDENRLEDEFNVLAERLLAVPASGFLYRDFQSRNVMIQDGHPRFIDFQSGRRGPAAYDVVSFLWQARAGYSDTLRHHLIETYLDEAVRIDPRFDVEGFRASLPIFVLFRTMQVLGAYGFRGMIEHKSHFLQSIPPALSNLRKLLRDGLDGLPYLTSVLGEVATARQFGERKQESVLTVRVISFSYRKGIPEDYSGNGGGFVFDCRAIHNPGRYDEYKPLTGMDEPVRRFLEEDGEVLRFLAHTDALVEASVERYLKRGFTDLMVCFGCTGGRHRSVYCAQHTAEMLSHRFGVRVELWHREQNLEKNFASR